MATDREIKGVLIKTYSGDAPSFGRGDIWYNSVNDKLRTSAAYAAGGTWSSGGTAPIGLSASGISVGTNNLNTIHYGASSSTIPANSNQPVSWTYSAPTTTWTQTAARNTARTDASGTGTSYTSCLIYGGSNNGESDPTPPGGPHSTAVEYFNGTTWTTIASLNTQRRYLRGCGSTDSAIVFGGDSDPPSQSLVESYNGSSWTEVADIPTAGNSYGNAGSSKNDVLIFGGPSNETNYFNGTTWTAASNITTGGGRPSGGGASASAIAAFGAPSPYNTVELYDVPAGGVAVDIDFTA
jgi:hypothetical protein